MKADKGQQGDKGHSTSLRSSQGNHTPGPWELDDEDQICAGNHVVAACPHMEVGFDTAGANARRVVACVNACEGIPSEELEKRPIQGDGWLRPMVKAQTQRDALAARNGELVETMRQAHRSLKNTKLKGKGNDFPATVSRVEQDLRLFLEKYGVDPAELGGTAKAR